MRLFWMRLALAWGCTVREAQSRCDAQEFADWLAFYRIDPWGEHRADQRTALLAMAEMAGKTRKPLRFDDWMLYKPVTAKPKDGRELWQKIKSGFQQFKHDKPNG